ncbi:MAG: ABC transporter ATP-binding protein [Bacteroides sp.]|nr:ABC transporter ATP-binding protein [Bacteroides sp.]MDD4719599.1 ABC transporter ATP-binding protein [Bacteroides sp.]
MLRLFSYLSKEEKTLPLIVVLLILNIVCTLATSYLLRPLINDYILPKKFNEFPFILTLLGSVYFLGVLVVFWQNRLLVHLGQNTITKLRQELFEKMERLPIHFFDKHKHGDLMSRYTNDMDRISEVLTDSLADLFVSILMLISIFTIMLYISPLLTLIVFITIPLMFLAVQKIVKRSRLYFQNQQKSMGELNGYIEEMIGGSSVIKVFNHEEKVKKDFRELNNKLNDESEKAQLYSGMMMPLMQNFNTLNYVFITVIGASLAITQRLDVGGLASFIQYSRQFGGPVNQLATLYNNLQSALASAERVFALLDSEPELKDGKNTISIEPIKGTLDFENVVFGYTPDKTILKGISFHVSAGNKIALVGPTGAGKTTIFNLLPRFYDINAGDIKIDNQSIYTVKRKELRKNITLVLQDTHLFSGTIKENIRYGNPSATDCEIIEAAKLATAHSFISTLPQGYNTQLENDGSNLSQGQRQLLNIARATIANPQILLLDEATSNIDSQSERLIQKGLNRLMEGKTTLIIAHRLSTVRNVDKILVIENGQIVEEGNHEELIAKKGVYESLYKEQYFNGNPII